MWNFKSTLCWRVIIIRNWLHTSSSMETARIEWCSLIPIRTILGLYERSLSSRTPEDSKNTSIQKQIIENWKEMHEYNCRLQADIHMLKLCPKEEWKQNKVNKGHLHIRHRCFFIWKEIDYAPIWPNKYLVDN